MVDNGEGTDDKVAGDPDITTPVLLVTCTTI